MKAREPEPVPRVALTYQEAADSLGLSLSSFRRYVAPQLRVIEVGTARLVAVAELRAWCDRTASLRRPE